MLLLQELLKDWPCTFTGEKFSIPVVGVTENSKAVKPGFLFVARKGEKVDGISYIEEAIRLGAAGIVLDRPVSIDLSRDVPLIVVPDCRKFLSHASARLSGNPSERLTIIAVTGTNGKTTVSHFIGQLLNGLGLRTAVIGTLGVFIDGVRATYDIPSMTTLPAEYLHPLLKDCEEKGIKHIIMEASSLGLSTDRLEDCEIDIGILLNVGVDHYEEHGSKEAYIQAKQKLVYKAKHLVVNCDDDICVDMTKNSSQPFTLFGTGGASDVQLINESGTYKVKAPTFEQELKLPVFEFFNQMNAVAAISALHILSHPFEEIFTHTSLLSLPEGRMQRIERNGVTVIIDYAHTPDALETVLQSLAKESQERIITVFGCGGNRDKGKRKEMGEIAAFYSSTILVTSDNPRNEDPLTIIQDITAGFSEGSTAVQVEVDRAKAIQRAISIASAGDIVLIAGKGHEKTQHIGREILPFSDVEIAEQALFANIK
ncbi:UDP-N-acetylmuramoyl-L-alanyl-D-glutamate--2,6-diaminopimelate ligase [Sporosarcina pasteurii]|uniref:UDP-N-acetylmuramoyl-L-alanyl-D-glutamate--2,6-diaminopimelate ligase n=1 Tax=Sporosarcina pasteurii TaxID=1474 RepID=A0A380BFP3_SPOPA|nr:UDP-N-acetylmuramoyl-L-alanyl-D-glutamate--2,6-diaminopimelate ligase [Sporosarcina pasteurii]MDS9470469.1 UDP-N-acetylmuramoyl-L-alanyl-D-glutamate--2,6-diaminopimelate ligase [Sporosarcina pasteurii]SUJ00283.1 UDP-N-acetylmuramoyl-L-alanyl-D-glutamate--LD-lysine ligase [Sporosarcina pasteurii]